MPGGDGEQIQQAEHRGENRADHPGSAINHTEPAVNTVGSPTRWEAMSNAGLDTHAPIGTVTTIGWNV